MVSSEIKMRVAQNCPGYRTRYAIGKMSMIATNESCSTCTNYIRGKCIEGLFDEVMETIRMN